jgi:hypothetical protein
MGTGVERARITQHVDRWREVFVAIQMELQAITQLYAEATSIELSE